MDYTAVGDTTNLAARVQQMAPPGSVVISAATHQHVAGFFETRDLGEMPVKGRAPVHAFEVLRPRSSRTRFDVAVERGLTPLVGRERELATLRERYREVKAGRGQFVGLAGEAGIGKSRLVLEFRRALAQAGEAFTWLEGHCISFGQASPFLPLIELLRANFQLDEVDGEPEMIAKVEQGMRRMGEVEAYIPAIRYLLSVDPGDPAFATLDGPARRRHLFAALRALSLRGAQRRPLVLVIEDLHWIDTSSEEFLTFLLDAVAGVPLLLFVTYRIGYTPPFGSRSFATTLTLQSFSEAETLAMAGQVLGTAQFPVELQSALMDKAEGVPLFIEEMTKTLLDLGVLQQAEGGYRLVKRLEEVHVPDTIQGIIMARLDRLGDEGKRTVQLASVIGRQFLVRLLAHVAGLSERLEGLLRELQALEIIYEQGLVPEPAYIFKHAVIQDVAYQSLLMQRRKALHRAVGEAIEDLYQDRLEEHYAELAHHFTQGEVWEKAFLYWRYAGARAFARSALREALACFEHALTALPRVPENQAQREQAIDLRLEMRNVLIALGDFRRMFALLCEAEILAQALEDHQRLGWVSAYLNPYFFNIGDLSRAIETAQRALTIAQACGDFALEMMATFFAGLPYLPLGDYQQAASYHRKNVEALTGAWLQEHFGEPGLPVVFCRAFLAWGLAELGAFAEGRGYGAEAVQIAQRVEQPFSLSHAYFGVGMLHLRQGEVPSAMAALEQGLHLCQTGDIQLVLPWVASSLGYVYALSGRLREALPLLEQAVEQSARMQQMVFYPLWMAHLSEAYVLSSRLEEARQCAEQALALSRDYKQRSYEAYALRLLGEIAVQSEPLQAEQAEAHYRQALALAAELGMRPLAAHCHRGLGTLYATTGQREQARAELSMAVEMYRGMAMAFWLPETEAALAQVAG
jgi:tetratricopeptide (TPR) repeat protein